MTADVLLVTCSDYPTGEPGHEVLDAALKERGIDAAWALWDDPLMDWSEAKLIVLRSVWDYDTRYPDFLAWAAGVGAPMLHGVDLFRWNTDKSYLIELAEQTRLPMVPSVLCKTPPELRAAIGKFGTSVVKPRVATRGKGMVLVYDSETWIPVEKDKGPWIVQPLMDSVQHEGEVSVFLIGGRPVSQLRKIAGSADIRSEVEHGGSHIETPLTDEAVVLAAEALASTTELLGQEVAYARVDMLRSNGKLLVSEVEITDPALELELLPQNAIAFADMVAAHLA